MLIVILALILSILTSCAVKQEKVEVVEKVDKTKEYEEKIRADFDEFLKKSKSIIGGM